jgi:hypothetical protein
MSKVSIKTEVTQTKRITPIIEVVRVSPKKKKILGGNRRASLSTIQNANPDPKTEATSDRIMCGFIQQKRIRCGKPNCRCARGEYHTAFYHVWYSGGFRFRRYVRRADVDELRAACLNYRNLQKQIRNGRQEYKQLFAYARGLIRAGIL